MPGCRRASGSTRRGDAALSRAMDTSRLDTRTRLLPPRLARLDPALTPRVPISPARLAAGTLGACLVLTFAAHAFPGPATTTTQTTPMSTTPVASSREAAEVTAVPTRTCRRPDVHARAPARPVAHIS